ncbi:hypothetical protein GOODEAATRI_025444, partial [Goodea atripinnis]
QLSRLKPSRAGSAVACKQLADVSVYFCHLWVGVNTTGSTNSVTIQIGGGGDFLRLRCECLGFAMIPSKLLVEHQLPGQRGSTMQMNEVEAGHEGKPKNQPEFPFHHPIHPSSPMMTQLFLILEVCPHHLISISTQTFTFQPCLSLQDDSLT